MNDQSNGNQFTRAHKANGDKKSNRGFRSKAGSKRTQEGRSSHHPANSHKKRRTTENPKTENRDITRHSGDSNATNETSLQDGSAKRTHKPPSEVTQRLRGMKQPRKVHSHENQGKVQQEIGVQLMLASLLHSHACDKTDCNLEHCSKMKMLLEHGLRCKVQVVGGCGMCKQLHLLHKMHVRRCDLVICPVPGCVDARKQLEELTKAGEAVALKEECLDKDERIEELQHTVADLKVERDTLRKHAMKALFRQGKTKLEPQDPKSNLDPKTSSPAAANACKNDLSEPVDCGDDDDEEDGECLFPRMFPEIGQEYQASALPAAQPEHGQGEEDGGEVLWDPKQVPCTEKIQEFLLSIEDHKFPIKMLELRALRNVGYDLDRVEREFIRLVNDERDHFRDPDIGLTTEEEERLETHWKKQPKNKRDLVKLSRSAELDMDIVQVWFFTRAGNRRTPDHA